MKTMGVEALGPKNGWMHSAACSPIFLVVLVGLLALILRLAFVVEILQHRTRKEIIAFSRDSPGYLHLAQNLSHTGAYALDNLESRFQALFRTPGYPLFCAVVGGKGLSLERILLAQAFLGALIPALTTLFVFSLLKKRFLSVCAGLASALSLTGIGLSGVIMVDLLFSTLFWFGFTLLYWGVVKRRSRLTYLAAAMFGLAGLVKPSMILWPAVSILVYFELARFSGASFKLKEVGLVLLLQLVPTTAWSVRNYYVEGTFNLSTAAQETLREYLAARVQRAADKDTGRHGVGKKHTSDDLLMEGVQPKHIAERQLSEALAIMRQYPFLTVRVWVQGMYHVWASSWNSLDVQLPPDTKLRSLLWRFRRIPYLSGRGSLLVLGFGIVSLFLPGRIFRKSHREENRLIIVLLLPVGYFAVLTGMTCWTGPRLIYPFESAFISLVIVCSMRGWKLSQSFLTAFHGRNWSPRR
jgi:hypothetical protein